MTSKVRPRRWMTRNAAALARRPDLWRTASRLARQHVPDRWWSRRPFLPVPAREWMAFRFETAFADVNGRPDQDEFIEYLEWARSWKYL